LQERHRVRNSFPSPSGGGIISLSVVRGEVHNSHAWRADVHAEVAVPKHGTFRKALHGRRRRARQGVRTFESAPASSARLKNIRAFDARWVLVRYFMER